MGRRISKEFLHPSILEGVNDKIGNLDSLETDAKGNMVQAINELVEKLDNSAEIEAKEAEIAEGKELIANAVGEPLTVEESFDEMSNDINGLLSTFKTNMMNSGITVESSDRFKSLIDKIATLADNEGKGVQFASGTFTIERNYSPSIYVDNLSFKPIIVYVQGYYTTYDSVVYAFHSELDGQKLALVSNSPNSCTDNSNYSELLDNGFDISQLYDFGDNEIYTWYAFGIGEEDTTLRDSLASILENKGVDITEEDDMASLISKVDDINVLLPATSSDSGVKTHYHLYMPTYEYSTYWNDEDNIDDSNNPAFLQCYVAPLADNMDVTISLNLATSGNSMSAYCQINVNGEKKYLFQVDSNSGGVDKKYTYSAKAGDYIELYLATSRSSATVRNVKIYSYYKTI